VFVAGGRGGELRARLRDVRERLDAAGLQALSATALPGRDVAYARALAEADARFPDVIVWRAERALDLPPPFVATVAPAVTAGGAASSAAACGAASAGATARTPR
jgi:hypothetical protein